MFLKFKKKKEDNLVEQQITKLITELCENEHTNVGVRELEPTNKYIIENKELHFDVIIDATGIILVNSVFGRRERFSDKYLSTLRKIAATRMNRDLDVIEERITRSERNILERMNNSISIANTDTPANE